MKVLLYTVFKDQGTQPRSWSESNAMWNSAIEVRSLKAEQYSPFLRSTFVFLRMTETPTEGAAKRYDLWPYTL
jgi:hypothetical protein